MLVCRSQGRTNLKKYRQSFRVVRSDGSLGKTLGEWLDENSDRIRDHRQGRTRRTCPTSQGAWRGDITPSFPDDLTLVTGATERLHAEADVHDDAISQGREGAPTTVRRRGRLGRRPDGMHVRPAALGLAVCGCPETPTSTLEVPRRPS